MRTLLIILFLSGIAFAQNYTSQPKSINDTIRLAKYSNTVWTTSMPYTTQSINIFWTSIFIKDGRLEITYDKDVKPSESVKQFFDWIKKYVEGEYYLIKRKDLDKILR